MEGLETKMAVQVKQGTVSDEEEEVACVGVSAGKKGSAGGGGGMLQCCQVENCNADLHDAKQYHRRHKVCEFHAKAEVVLVAGMRQRFCQQCSRFHELAEFDGTNRSCRRRLAGHDERLIKNPESRAQGSTGIRLPLKDFPSRAPRERESELARAERELARAAQKPAWARALVQARAQAQVRALAQALVQLERARAQLEPAHEPSTGIGRDGTRHGHGYKGHTKIKILYDMDTICI